jgi:cytochrome c biogenesis protein CcdA
VSSFLVSFKTSFLFIFFLLPTSYMTHILALETDWIRVRFNLLLLVSPLSLCSVQQKKWKKKFSCRSRNTAVDRSPTSTSTRVRQLWAWLLSLSLYTSKLRLVDTQECWSLLLSTSQLLRRCTKNVITTTY